MFGKLGEMFLESGRSYNPQYTVVHRVIKTVGVNHFDNDNDHERKIDNP